MSRRYTKRSGQTLVETSLVILAVTGCVIWSVNEFGTAMGKPFRGVSFSADPETAGTTEVKTSSLQDPPLVDEKQERWIKPEYITILGFVSMCIFSYVVFIRGRTSEKRIRQSIGEDFKEKVLSRQFEIPPSLFKKREKVVNNFMCAMTRETGMVIGDIMSEDPILIPENTSFERLDHIMKQKGIHHLLVGDAEEKRLAGILSDRDLTKKKCRTAKDAMTENPYSIERTAEIHSAVTLMLSNRVSSLPVMEGDKVVGIVSMSDLAVALQCSLIVLNDFFASSAPFCKVPQN